MAVELNHTIVACPDKAEAATWFSQVLGLPAPKSFGPFMVVELAHGLSLDFASTDQEIHPQLRVPDQRAGVRRGLRPDHRA